MDGAEDAEAIIEYVKQEGRRMTVKEFKEELSFYDDDAELIFEVDEEFEPEEITENKHGWHTVRLNSKLKPTFIGESRGICRVELGLED